MFDFRAHVFTLARVVKVFNVAKRRLTQRPFIGNGDVPENPRQYRKKRLLPAPAQLSVKRLEPVNLSGQVQINPNGQLCLSF